MASCLCELYIWSLKSLYAIPDQMVGCHVYHEKGEQVNTYENPYNEEKQHFTEGQDMTWSPRNKRPERLRDSIKEVELVLSNGCIISLAVSGHSGDVDRIFIDKSMVGKFSSDVVCDVFLTDQYMVACQTDIPRVEYAHFTRRPPLNEAAKRLDKLSTWEPKLLLWWSTNSADPWPWSPMTNDLERANLIVLSLNGPFIEVLTHGRTESDPVHAAFSGIQPHKIYTVEQSFGPRGEITVRTCVLEIIRGKMQTAAVVTIPLKGTVICQARNPGEDKLLLGCSDGSLVMYSQHKKLTFVTRCAVVPACLAWHPGANLIFAASNRGDIQVFDQALNPLRVQFVAEDPEPEKFLKISCLFRTSVTLKNIEWCMFDAQSSEFVTDYIDAMFLSLEKGPPALLLLHLGTMSRERFSAVELTKEYIKHRQIDEAVSLLESLNWDTEGASCYSCLSAIVNHLLRQPLNAEREAQLQATLATFYAPKPPISEVTIVEYRDPISRLARRFFHHLLRYARFDKAFLLAVDIGARDLFMDLHYMAQDKGETALAEVAKHKAEQVDAETQDVLDILDEGLSAEDRFVQHNGSHKQLQEAAEQENIIDQLPLSRQHPWQQEYYRQGAGDYPEQTRIQRNREIGNLAAAPTDDFSCFDDLGLDNNLISDYTAALMEPHKQKPGGEDNDKENGRGTPGKVKVIHFGIV
ncbi:hypothetical protein C0Q70_14083 [Pomacea canaliculata]|uniref:WD repeat-containing and planar cell polarity effector protein fritz homolog n=1 Tax=Pomacea canaliculata TaxID=400727 RepID=A0A2T7NZ07_POMCA|nr:hypothetical protein C0Q70_14083 [Pomacea canaliculata]